MAHRPGGCVALRRQEVGDMSSGTAVGASRYVVGIDLGTTNSAVCYVDTAEAPWKVRTFLVPQLVAPGLSLIHI